MAVILVCVGGYTVMCGSVAAYDRSPPWLRGLMANGLFVAYIAFMVYGAWKWSP